MWVKSKDCRFCSEILVRCGYFNLMIGGFDMNYIVRISLVLLITFFAFPALANDDIESNTA